jgi:DNA-3-methyladenine glycosylase I
MSQKNQIRCPWVDTTKTDYVEYHDKEWGVPVHDDIKMFEFLTLEAAQAGLSWYTILKKRGNYRAAFDNFDPAIIARYDAEKVQSLLADAGIIRNKLKVASAISNAQKFLEIREQFGSFDSYIWDFVGGKPIVHTIRSIGDYVPTSKESDALSKDLKSRGFKFLGSTVCYAHMQAVGMINDHSVDCFRREEIISQY